MEPLSFSLYHSSLSILSHFAINNVVILVSVVQQQIISNQKIMFATIMWQGYILI
jgi:hypothetical protein